MNSDSFAVARPDLERLVARRSEEHHCSIAWGVVAGGTLIATGASAHEPDPPATEQTIFRIASMTKSFTAAAILMLRDRGALRLDDLVSGVAPEFAAVIGPTTDSPPITIRDLLSMAAGMATDDVWADRHLDMADDELDRLLIKGATFAWPPQTHGEYSNLGYAMLGRIIERASGRRAQQFITQNLLLPLGMNRTTWKRPNHDDWARPFRVDDNVRVADIEPLGDGCFAAMGGLWSCVSDLTRWVSWLNDAFPARDDDEAGPLRRASRREMQQVHRAWPTEHVPASGEGDDAVPDRVDGGGYGFGLFVTHDTRFGHFVTHSGGLPGYGSNMRWLPDRGIGVIALGNATYVPMRALTRRMLELIDDHGLIPSLVERPSTALLGAAEELAVLLSDWTDDAANALFADNVALDEPYARRARQVSAPIAEHGPLTVAGVDATTAVSGRVTMRHADGAQLKIDLDLSPTMPPKLQFYEVVAG
ncbi:MAG: hypothetical protein QOJ74_491 [Ilumatobacteraceae bacterium]|nr:hypothetical protein [Ilumatobacteraceae bacterium]